MYDSHQDLLEGLRSTPTALERLVRTSRPAPGTPDEWNLAEVVWHLRDAEARALERMRAMRDQPRPFLAAYDQAALARDSRYAERDIDAGVKDFATLRRTGIAELEALAPEQWDREGQHEEVGTITIFNHAIHIAGHDLNHLAQLARLELETSLR
jgi:hypothetical protein